MNGVTVESGCSSAVWTHRQSRSATARRVTGCFAEASGTARAIFDPPARSSALPAYGCSIMNDVRITRALINNFRGWAQLDLRPQGHVLLAGMPRSGRSDIIAALRRVLDLDGPRTPRPSDIHQRTVPIERLNGQGRKGLPVKGVITRADRAEVEVTLTDLDPEIQQLFDGHLEPLDSAGHASEADDADPSAPQYVRLTYRLNYDADVTEAFVYFPIRSDPAISQYSRLPAATCRALPVINLNSAQPLQLRSGGALRRILDARDPDAATAAFTTLRHRAA